MRQIYEHVFSFHKFLQLNGIPAMRYYQDFSVYYAERTIKARPCLVTLFQDTSYNLTQNITYVKEENRGAPSPPPLTHPMTGSIKFHSPLNGHVGLCPLVVKYSQTIIKWKIFGLLLVHVGTWILRVTVNQDQHYN